MTKVFFGPSSQAWSGAVRRIEGLIATHKFHRVIELGGGANPTLDLEFIEGNGIEYTLLDISPSELRKAPDAYQKLCADICAKDFRPAGYYDFAFSRMLAEHVPDGERFHRNVRSLLRDDGMAFHFFPTLFAPPFVVNALLPDSVSRFILHRLQPGRDSEGKLGKFPARYSMCRGPSQASIRRLEALGYEVDEYAGFFGHEAYYRKLPAIEAAHRLVCKALTRWPIPALTSFAQILLRRTPIS